MTTNSSYNQKAIDLFEEIREKRDKFYSLPDNSERYFSQIQNFLKLSLKLNIHCYRESYIRRRVEAIMSRLAIDTYREFLEYLASPLFDKDSFIKNLTINVTEFFRDIGPFRYIESNLLPRIIQQKRQKGDNSLRIWSAGCATGEEPYSLAIILDWYLYTKNLKERIDAKIIATDLSPTPIAAAKKGCYSRQQLNNISEDSLRRNFDHLFGDKYSVKPQLRDYIEFRQHDLLSGEHIGIFDIVICRNVLIYINKDDQITVLKLFWESMSHPGYLILGKTESFPLFYTELFKYENLNEHVYVKLG